MDQDLPLSAGLLSREEGEPLRAAIERWAEETTATVMRKRDTSTGKHITLDPVVRETRLREKREAVTGFFSMTDRLPQDVRPPDVRVWCDAVEAGGRNASAVRAQVGYLSSFFEWLLKASLPDLPASQNPAKVDPRRLVKPVTEADWEERTEALLERTRSVRSGDTVNLRDFSPADLDELEELLRYQKHQFASHEDHAEAEAIRELLVSLEEFRLRLKKLRIVYMVVAMRAVIEINRRRGERGNWDMVVEEVRTARPSWRLPNSECFTLQWLDKLDALLLDSLNRRLTHVPRTRLASLPLAREGLIRFPSERIFKATLEALMPGAMLTGSAQRVALETLSDGGGCAADKFEAAYVFKLKRGDFEGVVGLPYGTPPELGQALHAMPSLAVKALFALWARLYAELDSPAFGESVTVSVSQFCDDLGYRRNRGAHEPENRRRAVQVLKALTALEAQITYQPGKELLILNGAIFNRVPLTPEVKGYADVLAPSRAAGANGAHGAEAFAYGPGAIYGNPGWSALNTSVAFAGEELLKLEAGNRDRWAVLAGGYLVSVARMDGYRKRTLNQKTVAEKTGLSRDAEVHRQVGRMHEKLGKALDRLQEVGFIVRNKPMLKSEDESQAEKVEIVWPDALTKLAAGRERDRKRHERAERRRPAGKGAKGVG